MSTFNPKISHKIAGFHIPRGADKTPWEYLRDWDVSDKEPDYGNARITAYMQKRWPGNYKVVHRQSPRGRFYYSDLEFDTPADETFFKLKYPK